MRSRSKLPDWRPCGLVYCSIPESPVSSMIIVMRHEATEADIAGVVSRLQGIGCEAHVSRGQLRTVIGAIGDRDQIQTLPWEAMAGVEKAVPVLKSFRFVSRDYQPDDSVIKIGEATFGGGHFTTIAGPCAAENRDQVMRRAEAVKLAGAKMLRGDAFKPRTSPYAFQGLGEAGLQLMAEA